MFGIGGVEFILILLFVFLVFGADRLPEIARIIGKAIMKFRKAQAEMNAAIQTDVKNLETDEQPFQKSVEAFDKFGKETVSTVKSTVKSVQTKNAATEATGDAAQGQLEKDASKPAETAEAKSEVKAEAAAQALKSTEGATTAEGAPKRESFTERKARYEAEKAAKAQAEAAAKEGASAPVASGEGE